MNPVKLLLPSCIGSSGWPPAWLCCCGPSELVETPLLSQFHCLQSSYLSSKHKTRFSRLCSCLSHALTRTTSVPDRIRTSPGLWGLVSEPKHLDHPQRGTSADATSLDCARWELVPQTRCTYFTYFLKVLHIVTS